MSYGVKTQLNVDEPDNPCIVILICHNITVGNFYYEVQSPLKPISIRWIIVAPILFLSIIIATVSYSFSSYTVFEVASSIGNEYAEEVELRISEHIESSTQVMPALVEINRHALAKGYADLNDLIAVGERFVEQANLSQILTFISVATVEGKYIASAQDPFAEISTQLSANFIEQPLHLAGYNYDPEKVIGERISDTFSYDPRTRPFYTDAVEKQGMVWSKIHPYYGYKSLGVGLSSPIYNSDGELLGVTAVSVALNELDDFLASLSLVEGSISFIAETDGNLIATSLDDQLFTMDSSGTKRVNINQHPNRLLNEAAEHLLPGQSKIKQADIEYFYNLGVIEHEYGEKWLIGTIIPTRYYQSVVSTFTKQSTALLAVFTLLLLIVGTLLARFIVKPIKDLSVAANDKNNVFKAQKTSGFIEEVNELKSGLISRDQKLTALVNTLEKTVDKRTQELQQANEQLTKISVTDELSGLLNRRGLNEQFEFMLAQARNQQSALTFVICDVDHFKNINDSCGHVMGDRIIRRISDTLRSHVSHEKGIVARYGGEEFAILLRDVDNEEVMGILSQIQESMRRITTGETNQKPITLSFGVTCLASVDGEDMESILHRSDQKLYQAKQEGRNRIIV